MYQYVTREVISAHKVAAIMISHWLYPACFAAAIPHIQQRYPTFNSVCLGEVIISLEAVISVPSDNITLLYFFQIFYQPKSDNHERCGQTAC